MMAILAAIFIVPPMDFRRFFCLFLIACLTVSGGITSTAADEHGDGQTEEVAVEDFKLPVYRNDIAAIVNDEIITMTQLMREVSFYVPKIRAESRSQEEFHRKIYECQKFFLTMAIERLLIVADFKAKGGKMPENYDAKEYEAFVHGRFNDDRAAFAKYLRDTGQSVREFKKNIRDSAIVGFTMHELQKTRPEVSSAKISEYYNEHIQEYIVDRRIFVKKFDLLGGDRDTDGLSEKLATIGGGICAGLDVGPMATKLGYTLETEEIGWICPDDMLPIFADRLAETPVGECTAPIVLDDRICLLFVADEKPAKKFTLEEVSDDIEQKLATRYRIEIVDAYLKKLKDKAYIKIFL
jgi:peptidyl-prolyl cis-trans isomerase SurA